MESLKIKCPVCGIFLEVTNSKNEAVKRIVCPNCKKTLAITFHGEEKTEQKTDAATLPALYYGQMRIALQEGQNKIPLSDAENLAIRVVRLNDGNCKCLVSAKRDNTVRLNDEYLLLNDEVALSDGDLLYIGKTVLSFNKPYDTDSVITDTPPIPGPDPKPKPIPPTPSTSKWRYVVIAFIAFVLCILTVKHFWPKEVEKTLVEFPDTQKTEKVDVPHVVPPVIPPPPVRVKNTDYTKFSTYELEKLALNNDVKAQYELGKRWVNRKDSINIVKGTNYLKLASRNGSAEARSTLLNVKSTLREAADNGNPHAENLLKVISGE